MNLIPGQGRVWLAVARKRAAWSNIQSPVCNTVVNVTASATSLNPVAIQRLISLALNLSSLTTDPDRYDLHQLRSEWIHPDSPDQ